MGRLSSKQHQNGAETINYTYNIRSWLTAINNGSWQEQVYYNNDPSQPYYNGNIARSTWTYNGITKGYMYLYDDLNRLTDSNYGEGSSLTTNQHLQDEYFTYDKMGNVTSIYRKNQGTVIDNVTLQYTGNHLKKGTDAAGVSTLNGITEYTDDADTIPEFYYDANGNLTADLDKNIVTIRYNVLNLPDTIQFGNGRQIINSYDAGGHKLTTQYYTPIGTITQGNIHGSYTTANSVLLLDDYCGSYLYENGTSASVHPLTRILTPEGYIDMSTSGYPYCYYKQDHLGSNREVTSYAGTTGTVVQQTEYYPSGTAYVEGTGAGIQPFKFTGKELIIMHGLNWQDYGARWLDNVRMQWTTMDPLCEKYYAISPYTYCSDDPAKNIDPDGRATSDFFNEDETEKHIDDGSTAQFKEIGSGVYKHYNFVGFDKSQSGYNTVNLTTAVQEQQKLNISNPALMPIPNGSTFCNYGDQNLFSTIASATNNSQGLLSIKGMATEMVLKMESSSLLVKVDQTTAHNASLNGGVGFIGEKDSPHGHVASFSTGDNINKGEVTNIGRYNGFLDLSPRGNGPSVFSSKSIHKAEFFILSPNITPKTEPTIIPFAPEWK